MIMLYGILDSRASRCLWMLEELGLEYESVPVHFLGDVSQPEYLAINPNGRIPALDDHGLVLFESLAINLHLARKYEGGLWPSDADNQSRAIQWSIWAMTELEPPVGEVIRNRSALPLLERDSAAAAGDVETALAALWMTVERGDLRYRELLGDPSWTPLRGDPRLDAARDHLRTSLRDGG